MSISRRGFLGGLLAAPAIVQVSRLMPVKLVDLSGGLTIEKLLHAKKVLETNDLMPYFVEEFRRGIDFQLQQMFALRAPAIGGLEGGADRGVTK